MQIHILQCPCLSIAPNLEAIEGGFSAAADCCARRLWEAEIMERLRVACGGAGYSCPLICTPEQLLGE
jgi:hypothetical protein